MWRIALLALLFVASEASAQTPGLDQLPAELSTEDSSPSLWPPLAVAGGGAALIGVGFLFHFLSNDNIDQFAEEVAIQCPSGCYLPGGPGQPTLAVSTLELRDRGHLERKLAIGSWILGAAALAGGVTWTVLRDVGTGGEGAVTVTASASVGGASAFVQGSF